MEIPINYMYANPLYHHTSSLSMPFLDVVNKYANNTTNIYIYGCVSSICDRDFLVFKPYRPNDNVYDKYYHGSICNIDKIFTEYLNYKHNYPKIIIIFNGNHAFIAYGIIYCKSTIYSNKVPTKLLNIGTNFSNNCIHIYLLE